MVLTTSASPVWRPPLPLESETLLFLDTEFTAFRDGRLLSVGVVSVDGGPDCYLEYPPSSFERSGLTAFVLSDVVAQMGRIAGAEVQSLRQLGERLGQYLAAISGDLALCYDYKLDGRFTEEALGHYSGWNRLTNRVKFYDIAHAVSSAVCRQALDHELLREDGSLRAHHALKDAKALRAAWLAR